MERLKVNNMYSDDDFILAINDLVNETKLNEFPELKEIVDIINLEVYKIILNGKIKKIKEKK